jgi:hypothetical protein
VALTVDASLEIALVVADFEEMFVALGNQTVAVKEKLHIQRMRL